MAVDFGGGAKGALSGGALGTAIMPGWGTAIGAGIGGLYGMFGGEDDPNSGKPQLGPDPWANHYKNLISQLQLQASGKGPSLAGQQYAAANQDAIGNQLMMSRGRGAGAARQGAIEGAKLGQGLAAGVAQARTREQMMAQQQLLGAIQAASGSQNSRDLGQLQASTVARNDPSEMERNMGMAGQVLSAYELSRQRDQEAELRKAQLAKLKGQPGGMG